MKYIIISLICLFSLSLLADEHNEQFGKNKAITAIKNKGEEFKLSKESIQTLGITLRKIKKLQNFEQIVIPKESLVKYLNTHSIYINRNGWFKLLELKILRRLENGFEVSVSGIMENDKLVVTNAGLLRVAHIHASGGLRGVDLD